MTLTYELCDARTYEVCHSFICDDALTHDVCEYVSQDVRHPCNDWCICSIPHLHPWQHAHVYNFKFAYECIIVYICNLYVSFAKEPYKRGDIWLYTYMHAIRAIIYVYVPHIYTNYCTYGSTQSIIEFSRSLLPRSVENRPIRLRFENEIKCHFNCNTQNYGTYLCICAANCKWSGTRSHSRIPI